MIEVEYTDKKGNKRKIKYKSELGVLKGLYKRGFKWGDGEASGFWTVKLLKNKNGEARFANEYILEMMRHIESTSAAMFFGSRS